MTTNRIDAPTSFAAADSPNSADLSLCVHCGFCLSACPTYLALGVETDSPRGRLYLMRALEDGRIDLTPRVQRHFDQCLQCRACETACPSAVPYGRLMEATRASLFERMPRRGRRRLLWNVVMRGVLPHPKRLRRLVLALRFYQRSRLQWLVRTTGLLRLLRPNLADLEALAPDATRPFFEPHDVERYAPSGVTRARAAMLTGCVMPLFFPATHHATTRVLSRNGVEVSAPATQVCCGALHAHSGDLEMARVLARRNIDAFLAAQPVAEAGTEVAATSGPDPDAIVVNAAGCSAHMKDYATLLRDDPVYAERAQRFAALVRDVHEYLLDLGFDPPAGQLKRTVTYQDSCHLAHAQNVRDAPRALLRAIPGLQLREMTSPDRCCAAAGIYVLVQRRLSQEILRDKMAEIAATGADQVCTANPGCMVQLDAGLRLHDGAGTFRDRTAHVIDLLDESYRLAEGDSYADRPAKRPD